MRCVPAQECVPQVCADRKSTRLNSSHLGISYAVFCLKKKKQRRHKLGSSRSLPRRQRHHHHAAPASSIGMPIRKISKIQTSSSTSHFFFFFLNEGAPPKTPLFPPRAPFRI